MNVKIEKHKWGYFLYTANKAVAVVSHKEEDLRKALRREFGQKPSQLTPK